MTREERITAAMGAAAANAMGTTIDRRPVEAALDAALADLGGLDGLDSLAALDDQEQALARAESDRDRLRDEVARLREVQLRLLSEKENAVGEAIRLEGDCDRLADRVRILEKRDDDAKDFTITHDEYDSIATDRDRLREALRGIVAPVAADLIPDSLVLHQAAWDEATAALRASEEGS